MTTTVNTTPRPVGQHVLGGVFDLADAAVSTAPGDAGATRESDDADGLRGLSNQQMLAAAARLREMSNRAEVRLLEAAVAYLDANPPQVLLSTQTWVDPWAEGQPLAGPGSPLVCGYAVAEFVTAIGMSTGAGDRLVRDALELSYRLPRTWELLRSEQVPVWRARNLAQRTVGVSKEAAGWADQQCAPYLGKISQAQLDRTVAAAVARFDPQQAANDAAEAAQRRGVWFSHTQPDPAVAGGVTEMTAVLDHLDAITLDHALNTGAAALKAAGSNHTHDARRAMALGDLARAQTTLPLNTGNHTADTNHSHRTDNTGNLTAAADNNEQTSRVCDHGRATLGDPVPDTPGPGQTPPPWAEYVTNDQLTDWLPRHDPDEPPAYDHDIPAVLQPDPRPHCAVQIEQTQFMVHLHLVASPNPGTHTSGSSPATGPEHELGNWILDPTGHVQRTGTAVTTAQIRSWLTRPDTKITVRPIIHTGIELSTDAYTPTDVQAEQTRAKHPTCVFPYCTRPATTCDIDHRVPWPHGETTSNNLYPLCRRHHILRTHRAWTYEPDPETHGLIWTSPGVFPVSWTRLCCVS